MATACPDRILTGCQFAALLLDQPINQWQKEILKAMRPTDGWVGNIDTGSFPCHSGVEINQSRLEVVYPNTTKEWTAKAYTDCIGHPCDHVEHEITWGSTNNTYHLEEIHWATPLLCYNQTMHYSHAVEQWRQIINDILRPATAAITSAFIRKRVLQHAGKKWVADASMTDFTYVWQTVGDEEIYLCTSAMPTSLLTPSMLARRVHPLMSKGYFGKDPFGNKKDIPLIELVTGLETCWELDHMGGTQGIGGTQPSIAANWRFQQWSAASEFWRYGLTGQIGNFAARVDPYELRFNYVDANGPVATPYRFQIVLPFTNSAATVGLKSDPNDDYQTACYRMSFIWHRQAMQLLTLDNTVINPEMPFARPNHAGTWRFVMDNLGADCNGIAISNKERNKGQFIAGWEMAMRPRYAELAEAIFHMGEPSCVTTVAPCQTCAYPEQTYSSAPHLPDDCDECTAQ